MPTERELHRDTILTANLHLSLKAQKDLLEFLNANLGREHPDSILSLTIEGVS